MMVDLEKANSERRTTDERAVGSYRKIELGVETVYRRHRID